MKKSSLVVAVAGLLVVNPASSQNLDFSLDDLCGSSCPTEVIAASSGNKISLDDILALVASLDAKTGLFTSAAAAAEKMSGVLSVAAKAAAIEPAVTAQVSESFKSLRDSSNNVQVASVVDGMASLVSDGRTSVALEITVALSSGKASVLDEVAASNY